MTLFLLPGRLGVSDLVFFFFFFFQNSMRTGLCSSETVGVIRKKITEFLSIVLKLFVPVQIYVAADCDVRYFKFTFHGELLR